MKKLLLITIIFLLNSYSSYGKIDGKGIWCHIKNENIQPFHYWSYFFQNKEIIEYEFKQKNDRIILRGENLGKYKTTSDSIKWRWKSHSVILDRKTLTVKYSGLDVKHENCEVYNKKEWKNKKNQLLRYYQNRYDKKRKDNKI